MGNRGGKAHDGAAALDCLFLGLLLAPGVLTHPLRCSHRRQFLSGVRAAPPKGGLSAHFTHHAGSNCLPLQSRPLERSHRRPDRHARAYPIPSPDHRLLSAALPQAGFGAPVPDVALPASWNHLTLRMGLCAGDGRNAVPAFCLWSSGGGNCRVHGTRPRAA